MLPASFHDDFLFYFLFCFVKLQHQTTQNTVSYVIWCKKLAEDPVSGWVSLFINLEFIIFIFVIPLTILAINIHVCGVIE